MLAARVTDPDITHGVSSILEQGAISRTKPFTVGSIVRCRVETFQSRVNAATLLS